MDTDGFRKAIHLDLDTATVESTFGKKNTSMAYRKIRKFLESNGFAKPVRTTFRPSLLSSAAVIRRAATTRRTRIASVPLSASNHPCFL